MKFGGRSPRAVVLGWLVLLIFAEEPHDMTIISGIVHDPIGQPVVQARVYFMSGPVALPDIATLTNDGGAFTLSAPSEGNYHIGIAADGFAPTSIMVTVKKGEQAVKLKLKLSAVEE